MRCTLLGICALKVVEELDKLVVWEFFAHEPNSFVERARFLRRLGLCGGRRWLSFFGGCVLLAPGLSELGSELGSCFVLLCALPLQRRDPRV